jgi:hypothetical protein
VGLSISHSGIEETVKEVATGREHEAVAAESATLHRHAHVREAFPRYEASTAVCSAFAAKRGSEMHTRCTSLLLLAASSWCPLLRLALLLGGIVQSDQLDEAKLTSENGRKWRQSSRS